MPYFSDLNVYLHQSSLLIQAYPTTRITTKYSLPRKPNVKAKSPSGPKPKPGPSKDTPASATESAAETSTQAQPKRDRSATLTLKTYHSESGICLKYRTDKAAEVGRLLTGLGRLAKGETIETPSTAAPASAPAAGVSAAEGDADKMDIDSAVVKMEDKVATAPPAAVAQHAGGGSGGKAKKKKSKK
jgi:hypothetical protein